MPSTTTVQPSVTAHVHPLVLLSATDHYNRVAKDTKKRVVGVLLGQNKGKTVNVSNSFAGKLFDCSCNRIRMLIYYYSPI